LRGFKVNKKIRVLVVDDSAIMRKLITEILKKDQAIEIVGEASDGVQAIEKAKELRPDVITLDIEMPKMDGLTALKYLKKESPNSKIIMFSSLTQEGAKATIEALSLGAHDFVPKPSSKSFVESVQKIEKELVPKIKALVGYDVPLVSKVCAPTRALRPGLYRVLGIGVSTGGPQTLAEILKELPSNFPVPILIVQHMPPLFTAQLAERLDRVSKLKVKEAEDGEPIKEGVVYIAPGDYHMEVSLDNRQKHIRLHQGPPRNNCRPAVDVLFESLADVYGGTTLGLILTGMGRDGLEGAKKIKARGGGIIAQDKETSVVYGMPRAVVEAGLADEILPLPQIPQRLKELFRSY
jgi:two-component system chemotaxis response regulator CheB